MIFLRRMDPSEVRVTVSMQQSSTPAAAFRWQPTVDRILPAKPCRMSRRDKPPGWAAGMSRRDEPQG